MGATKKPTHVIAVLVLAVGLIAMLIIVTIGNVVIRLRCAESFDHYVTAYVEDYDSDAPPLVCDTTAELRFVLDIGLALAGGLVGFLAHSADHASVERQKKDHPEGGE